MKLVLIEWIDSYGCSPSWEDLVNHAPDVMTCRSVGWLMHDGEQQKTIVPHIAHNEADSVNQGCGDMTIPCVAITRIVELSIPVREEEL